jgi:hypothetical protein
MSTRTEQERQAYELGVEHAKNAASWVIDGDTDREWIVETLRFLDDGDPRIEDRLPREPNLSGEYADDPTPTSLYREITGREPIESLAFETEHGQVMDALADAYEQGVSDTFEGECERILREAIA